MATNEKTPPAHAKVLHGRCSVCGHYGEDCAGSQASTHTPGLWQLVNHNEICIDDEHETFIAEVHDGLEANGEWRANARLIAAAPDLLRSCEELLERMNLLTCLDKYDERAIRRAETALNKAYGISS